MMPRGALRGLSTPKPATAHSTRAPARPTPPTRRATFMAIIKVHYYVAATLDGFIARRDGSVDFLEVFEDPACDYGYAEFIASIGTVVMGRRTYEDALRLGKGGWTTRSHGALASGHVQCRGHPRGQHVSPLTELYPDHCPNQRTCTQGWAIEIISKAGRLNNSPLAVSLWQLGPACSLPPPPGRQATPTPTHAALATAAPQACGPTAASVRWCSLGTRHVRLLAARTRS